MKDHQLGLVLSGGGIRGVAHVGLLQALLEQEIRPTAVAGVSAGAIVGAVYAAGYAPEKILHLFKETQLFSWSNYSLDKPGLLDSEKFIPLLEEYLGGRNYEDLDYDLHVAATDLLKGDCHVFHSGPVLPTVLASAAFPFIFSPVKIGDGIYADGGTVNNLPVEPLQSCCEYLIGSYVNPVEEVTPEALDSTLEILQRTYRIATNYSSFKKLEACDWRMAPDELMNYNIFDLEKAQEIYDIGYREGQKLAEEIAKALG